MCRRDFGNQFSTRRPIWPVRSCSPRTSASLRICKDLVLTETVHVVAYDTLADWEIGFATAHINKPLWHKTPGRFATATVGASTEPITTMGGTRVLPGVALTDLRPRTAQ
jgi:hypothetical protein